MPKVGAEKPPTKCSQKCAYKDKANKCKLREILIVMGQCISKQVK